MESYVQNPDIAWRMIDGAAVLVDPSESIVRQLNETGSMLWELLEEPRTVEECAAAIAGEFVVGEKDAENDAREFIEELVRKKLLLVTTRPD